MRLEYNQWVDLLKNDDKLKEKKVDIAWNSLVKRRKEVREDLFNLLYDNKYLNFSYEDWNLQFEVNEDKVKAWNKRHYNRYDTYIFVKEKVPQVLKQTSITRYTAEKIAIILDGMKYCDQLLSKSSLATNPLKTKTTKDIVNGKHHYMGTQLEIPFDYDDNINNEGKSNDINLTDEQMDELYRRDDDEEWWKR